MKVSELLLEAFKEGEHLVIDTPFFATTCWRGDVITLTAGTKLEYQKEDDDSVFFRTEFGSLMFVPKNIFYDHVITKKEYDLRWINNLHIGESIESDEERNLTIAKETAIEWLEDNSYDMPERNSAEQYREYIRNGCEEEEARTLAAHFRRESEDRYEDYIVDNIHVESHDAYHIYKNTETNEFLIPLTFDFWPRNPRLRNEVGPFTEVTSYFLVNIDNDSVKQIDDYQGLVRPSFILDLYDPDDKEGIAAIQKKLGVNWVPLKWDND